MDAMRQCFWRSLLLWPSYLNVSLIWGLSQVGESGNVGEYKLDREYFDTFSQIISPRRRRKRPVWKFSTDRISSDETVFRSDFLDSLELKLTVLRYLSSL